jgi:CubicO group peptidase (beta-lactamase class C family)
MPLENVDQLDALIEPVLREARVPGAAIAVTMNGRTAFARGYGLRDLASALPLSAQTIYPIASTTKAMNATLLGMLVDEGELAWDEPVQSYLPGFRLGDPLVSAQVTLRDLLCMRTGLPRHDWLWQDNPISRSELMKRLRHLELSAGFRQRFQYNNLTVTTAGHVAEVVTGKPWQDLIRERLFEPLGMSNTVCARPTEANVTLSYHENRQRELLLTRRLEGKATAPSGGAVHSTVEDMARWMSFNLKRGEADGRALIWPETLAQIHAPQVCCGDEPTAPSPYATYAMGWYVDNFHGCGRWSHGGLHHGVNSSVMLFPQQGIGIVAFVNFAASRLAAWLAGAAFELMMGFEPQQTLGQALDQYERKMTESRRRIASVRRVKGTSPSHDLADYVGRYEHAGYGRIDIAAHGGTLLLKRCTLALPLQHLHYDVWTFAPNDLLEIHQPHAFDQASLISFETDLDGAPVAFSIRLEPALCAIRFQKQAR